MLVREDLGLAAILAGFSVLGIVYSIVTPRFESPDEVWHYAVVQHVASGRGLPVMEANTKAPYRQEGAQAPLNYVLGAALTFWIDQSDWQEITWENPLPHSGAPGSSVNKNLFIHTRAEGFPWRDSVLALHLVRFFSVLLGALSVTLVYAIARELFPQRKAVALGAAALTAFNPQFLFIHGSVNNDALLVTASSTVLLLSLRLLRQPLDARQLIALGTALGLALLSKLSALWLIPIVGLALILRSRAWEHPRRFVGAGVLVGVPVLLIAGWWFARNILLYGEPTGWRIFEANIGFRPTPLSLDDLGGEFWGTEVSYWGMFGWFNVPMDEWLYSVLALLSRAALAGLVVSIVWRRQRVWSSPDPALGPGLLVLASWLLLLAASWLYYMFIALAGQGRYFFPASAAISLFLFLGLAAWVPRHWEGRLAAGWGTCLAILSAAAPFLYIAPAYAWPVRSTSRPEGIAAGIEATYGDRIQLVGATVPAQTVGPGEQVEVILYWRALAPIPEDYIQSIKVFGPQRKVFGQIDAYPGRGTYPTSLWVPGEFIQDSTRVPVTGVVDQLSVGWIEVVLYRWPSGEQLSAFDPMRVRAGGTVHLTLYWKVLAPLAPDYTVFTHLVDETGTVWGQKDQPPLGGDYPTSLWGAGETIRDEYAIPVSAQAPPSAYTILVGMYLLEMGERLPATDGQGNHLANDAIPLVYLRIEGQASS